MSKKFWTWEEYVPDTRTKLIPEGWGICDFCGDYWEMDDLEFIGGIAARCPDCKYPVEGA